MLLSNQRIRLRRSVERLLLSKPPDHPLRRFYAFVRRAPLATRVWRAISGGDRWRNVSIYCTAGGKFADAPAVTARRAPHYPSEEFFAELVRRIGPPRAGCAASGKIVLVNNGLSAGGAERQIVYTLKGLKEAGFDATFIGEYIGKAPGLDFHLDQLGAVGVPALALERSTQPGKELYAGVSEPVAELLAKFPAEAMIEILDMAAMMRRLRPEIVHLWQDDTATKHAFSAMIGGARRIVLSGRNLNPTHFAYHRPEMRAIYRALLDDPRIVLSNNSHAGANSYGEWLGCDASTIRVIHNGLEPTSWPSIDEASRAVYRKELGVPADAVLICGVFRLSPEKRPLLWLESAAEALSDAPHLRFVIAGAGPMQQAVSARAGRPDLVGRVLLLGEIKNVSVLLASSDMMVLTSAEEGLPNVLLEAQATGCTIVVTDAGGAREAMKVGASGVIADDDAPSAIGALIVRIASDEKFRANARAAGPAFVRAHFAVDKMLAMTLECYRVGGR